VRGSRFQAAANVLRALIGDRTSPRIDVGKRDRGNIDDSVPGVGLTLSTKLMDCRSARRLPAAAQMKKNRPGPLLRIIAVPEDQSACPKSSSRRLQPLGLESTPPSAASNAYSRSNRNAAGTRPRKSFRQKRIRPEVRRLQKNRGAGPALLSRKSVAAAQEAYSKAH
jgi:hypothetical protein